AGRRDLADEIGFATGVDADSGDEIGNQIGDFETDGARLVDAAMSMGIDGLDGDCGVTAMLTIDGGGDDRGGKTGERADLDNAPGRENADERGKKKIIPRADPAGIANIIEIHHGMEKIHLARRGDFAGMTQLFRELSVLDFELLERLEL